MKFAIKALTASLALACATGAMAQKGETVSIREARGPVRMVRGPKI